MCLGPRDVGGWDRVSAKSKEESVSPHPLPTPIQPRASHGAERGLTSSPQHRGNVGGKERELRRAPPGNHLLPPLVISGSIYLVKKGVSGNAN